MKPEIKRIGFHIKYFLLVGAQEPGIARLHCLWKIFVIGGHFTAIPSMRLRTQRKWRRHGCR